MLCKCPYRKGVMEYGCGQCMPCRINMSRVWIARMLLELNDHEQSAFVTLTYSDNSLPVDRVLVKQDLQKFIKRLRFYVEPRKIRYFGVGEYGEQTARPHYHLIIYGISPTEEEIVQKAWTKGFIYLGTAEAKSMQYVSGYVLKNMRSKNDRRLHGRPPEFSVQSKRPGLGSGIIAGYKKAYSTREGKAALTRDKWFGQSVKIANRQYPLGRYLKLKIQEELKFDKVSKKAYLWSQMYQVYAKKSAQTTTEYERQRKAKVTAGSGRYQKQLQTL